MIYDTSHKLLLELKEKVEKCGMTVYSCNTDCLYIERDLEKLKLFKRFNPEYFDFTDKNNYDAIGKLKIDFKSGCNINDIRRNWEDDIYDTIPHRKIKQSRIELKDEFNRDEIAINLKNNKVIINADIAGAGKTSSTIYYAKKNKLNTIIVSPYNTLCNKLNCDFKEQGLNNMKSITLNRLLGERFDGNDITASKSYDIEGVNLIVFDEIYLYDTTNLSKIENYMRRHNTVQYLATGDENQLKPIEELVIKDKKKYYKDIIDSLFDYKILLKENKRCKTDEDRTKIKNLTNEIRNATTKKEFYDIITKYDIKTTDKIITKKMYVQ